MKTSTVIGTAALVVGIGIAAVGWWIYEQSFVSFHEATEDEEVQLAKAVRKSYAITIVGEPSTPTVLADLSGHGKEPTEVSCTTCHTTREADLNTRSADKLDVFHQGLEMQHGGLSCLSCHNSDNYDTLRLADSTAVPFEQTMQLCAQCHGPQHRDFQRGSHGGMTGYWDLEQGPRTRNACIVCHDPHAPAYPQLMPVFPPKMPKLHGAGEARHASPAQH